jgi:hypothetical protein
MRRSGLPALAAAVLCVVMAACSDGDSGDAAEVVRASPAKTIDSGTSRVALEVNLETGTGGQAAVRGDGVFDMRAKRGTFTLDLGALAGSLGGGNVESVLDGQTMYVKLPAPAASAGKPWFRVDLASAAQQAGVNLGSLGQLRQSDPTQALEYLRGATDDVRRVGEEQVRGVSTTHYRATVDLNKAAASLPPDARAANDELVKSLGTSTLPSDVWIDDDGRVRRMRFSLDADGSGPGPATTVNLELFEFGVPVTVEVPPADQVTDLTNLFSPPTLTPR